jgi:hypothetical protein
MQKTGDYLALRPCLLSPIPEHDTAAEMLSDAADAILAGDLDSARDLVRRADMPALFEHASLVMNGRDPNVQRRRPIETPTEKAPKVAARMPSGEATKKLFAKDGWRCRFCNCRVVPPRVRTVMRAALPGAIPWSETEGYHGAFFAMSASVDHVVPHSAGGTNDEENLVTACWSCQFGRGAWSLEEVGLLDPRARPPVRDEWDGLERLLSRQMSSAVVAPTVPPSMAGPLTDIRDVPPPSPKRSRLSDAEWFASLDAIQPLPSDRLLGFVAGCSDLGMSWSLNKVLIVRMRVGTTVMEILGVQRDGLVEIPWSIGVRKSTFKSFAEMLAAGIPGAIVYETPKHWVVSKVAKRRLNLLEVLEAAPTLRRALETLHSELRSAF